MKDNLDNLDNEPQNPTLSKPEKPVNLDETPKVETPQQPANLDEPPKVETPQQPANPDETPNVETPQQPANLDEPPKVETPQQPANLDEPPKVETPQQPANLETQPTDSTTTPSAPAQPDNLDNPDPEYSETKKMEKIAAIIHNKEEYRKQLENEKQLNEEIKAEGKRLNEQFAALLDKERDLQNLDGRYISPEESKRIADAIEELGKRKNELRQKIMANNARKGTVTPPTDN